MFFHGAFLVPDRSVDVLQGLTGEWNRHHEAQGLRLELSGPWPPYHFAPVLEMQEMMAYLLYGITKDPVVKGGPMTRGEGPEDILRHRSWPVRRRV